LAFEILQEAQATLELVVTDVTASAQWFIEELAHQIEVEKSSLK